MNDERLYHSVTNDIKKLILEGSFPPGSRLPGERELAERFEVSRATIREAEIALQALGFIRIKTGSGVYVQSSAELNEQKLPNVSAFELTEARSMFESEAAALTARQIDDKTLCRLEELIETMSNEDPEYDEASQEADRDFHLTHRCSLR